mmetsp:Transcript_119468/g.234772  ORF Transcript_119468/g.234772 Transcript_119468/m.234772 type:complete len:274 (-) Transcript_119468:201-1022(-)|eukprot:CAMPEP_0170370050 /NCGR_PEP_ID=MMETSP0117_2-20130122/8307_1 /TAXON_ID=400756 /ORGANISM="Durinskia baltica, Strain CSIRO CS-38" /LENGTH=273 /DNA_ID=CAMNT_0010624805 /DNA_START=102 /DNA_END=923 /DNA_ORIENTATION=+
MLKSAADVSRTVLVTGSSRGIGLGIVRTVLEKYPKSRVIATCRSPDSAPLLSALNETYGKDRLLILPLDTTDISSHRTVLNRLAVEGIAAIDVLVVNAGIASANPNNDPPLTSTSEDMLNVYNTNVVGSLLTMQSYHGLLCAGGAKLVFVVSSLLGSIENAAGSGGRTAYRTSKAALNMLAMTYSEDSSLRAAGGKVVALHPGWVQTDMGESGGRKAPVTVKDSVDGILTLMDVALGTACVESEKNSAYRAFGAKMRTDNCVFVAYNGELLPW